MTHQNYWYKVCSICTKNANDFMLSLKEQAAPMDKRTMLPTTAGLYLADNSKQWQLKNAAVASLYW